MQKQRAEILRSRHTDPCTQRESSNIAIKLSSAHNNFSTVFSSWEIPFAYECHCHLGTKSPAHYTSASADESQTWWNCSSIKWFKIIVCALAYFSANKKSRSKLVSHASGAQRKHSKCCANCNVLHKHFTFQSAPIKEFTVFASAPFALHDVPIVWDSFSRDSLFKFLSFNL